MLFLGVIFSAFTLKPSSPTGSLDYLAHLCIHEGCSRHRGDEFLLYVFLGKPIKSLLIQEPGLGFFMRLWYVTGVPRTPPNLGGSEQVPIVFSVYYEVLIESVSQWPNKVPGEAAGKKNV